MNFRHVQKSTQRSKSSAQEPILEPKVWPLNPKWSIFYLLFDNFSEWRIYPPLRQEHDFHDFNVRKIEYFSIIFLQFWSFFQVAFGGVKNDPPKVIFYVKNWFLRFSVTLPNRGIDHFGSQIGRRSCKEGLWSVKNPTAPKPKKYWKT